MLSISAFNALLKTLEEPPEHVVFVLATTEVHKVPETIISRTQKFDFKKVPAESIVKRLRFIAEAEKVKIDDDVLASIAYRSGGFIRDAENLLGQVFSLGEKNITKEISEFVLPAEQTENLLALMEPVVAREAARALSLINDMFDEGTDLVQFNRDLVEYWRKLLLIKIMGAAADKLIKDLPEQARIELKKMAKRIDDKSLEKILLNFVQSLEDIKNAELEILPLEIAIIASIVDEKPPIDQRPLTQSPA